MSDCLFTYYIGVWSSPVTTGSRPPPCGAFSFTAIDSHRAVLFGGYNREHGKMNGVYIINIQTMVRLAFGLLDYLFDAFGYDSLFGLVRMIIDISL